MTRLPTSAKTNSRYRSRFTLPGAITIAGLFLAVPAFAENYLVFATKDFRFQSYIDTDRITKSSAGFAAWRFDVQNDDSQQYTYLWTLNHYYCQERKIVNVAFTSYDNDWSVIETYSTGSALENVEPGDVHDRLMSFVCEAEDKRWERTVLDAPQDLGQTAEMAKELFETIYYDDREQSLMRKKRGE